jgi:hypothetical protein
VEEALARGVPHPHAVRQPLERRRQQRELPPPVAVALPDDPRVRGLVVRPHDLRDYDYHLPDHRELPDDSGLTDSADHPAQEENPDASDDHPH